MKLCNVYCLTEQSYFSRILFKQVETSGPMSAKKDKVHRGFFSCHFLSFCVCVQGKSNSVLCLEGFNQLLLTMSTWFSPSSPLYSTSQTRQGMSLDDFLVYVNPTLSDKDPNERIHYFIGFFEVHQTILMRYCDH